MMSERQEHKRRYNQRLEYIATFQKWIDAEPPMIKFWAWRKWLNNRPVWVEPPKEVEYWREHD